MIVRRLNQQQVSSLVEPGRRFCEEAGLPPLNPETFTAFFQGVLSQGIGVVFECEHNGVPISWMGGFVTQDPFSGERTAMESFWFSSPDSRGRGMVLLRAFEEWAKEVEADKIIMVHLSALNPERLGKIYERRGYATLETNYIKRIR